MTGTVSGGVIGTFLRTPSGEKFHLRQSHQHPGTSVTDVVLDRSALNIETWIYF